MPTRLTSVVIDATDPPALARFWSTATGWPITLEIDEEVDVEPPEDEDGNQTEPGINLTFVPVDDPKEAKNRVHLDLATTSADHQAELVERVRRAGATPLDIGQGAVPWVVLADPEGNEFCVLEPRPEYERAGAVAAIVLDTPDPAGLASFWEAASGWIAEAADLFGNVTLRPPGGEGPHLELLPTADPKVAKNRVHLDVAPYSSDDHGAEVSRLRALGAADVDVGQGQRTWTVLTDPQGNEFCVLSPRG